METRRERFDRGQAPVYPLPQRDPMRLLADWGMPPDPPIQPDQPGAYERPWDSPGRPPWATGFITTSEEPERRVPGWAGVCIAVGVTLLAVTTIWTVALLLG